MGLFDSITDSLGLTNHSGDAALAAQTNAANAANATQQGMYDQTRSDLTPYRSAGDQAVGQLTNTLPSLLQSYSGQDLTSDPGYQFRLSQGLNAVQNSAAARGALNSGATLKALTQYGQNFASNEYNNAYNRFNNDRQMKYNMLSGLAGMGQNAAAQTGSFGANTANQIASNQIGLGNSHAANDISQTNRITNLLGQGAQVGGMALAGYMARPTATPATTPNYAAQTYNLPQLQMPSGILASDRRLKTNIRPVSREDLKELKSVIKPQYFEYLDPDFGKGKYLGVMAQDLEKSKLGRLVVFKDKDGFKKIDLKKFASLLLASLAEEAA